MNRLIELPKEQESISIRKLSEMLNVSEMTIRRDLKSLEENDVINRDMERANLERETPREDFKDENYELLSQRKRSINDEKERIGKYAATLVSRGDILILDTGSTTRENSQIYTGRHGSDGYVL